MLAQNFKSAADLGITEPQLSALQKTLVLLETGKLTHIPDRNGMEIQSQAKHSFTGKFNMNSWQHTYADCGTIACIGGTAELIGGVSMDDGGKYGSPLYRLFYPDFVTISNWDSITPDQAATALRSYLTTGDARWDLAVAS